MSSFFTAFLQRVAPLLPIVLLVAGENKVCGQPETRIVPANAGSPASASSKPPRQYAVVELPSHGGGDNVRWRLSDFGPVVFNGQSLAAMNRKGWVIPRLGNSATSRHGAGSLSLISPTPSQLEALIPQDTTNPGPPEGPKAVPGTVTRSITDLTISPGAISDNLNVVGMVDAQEWYRGLDKDGNEVTWWYSLRFPSRWNGSLPDAQTTGAPWSVLPHALGTYRVPMGPEEQYQMNFTAVNNDGIALGEFWSWLPPHYFYTIRYDGFYSGPGYFPYFYHGDPVISNRGQIAGGLGTVNNSSAGVVEGSGIYPLALASASMNDKNQIVSGPLFQKFKAPQRAAWWEEFDVKELVHGANPDDSYHAREINNEGVILASKMSSAPQSRQNPTFTDTLLLPFELNSDLNNDGKAGEGADSSLKTAGKEDSASEDAKEKATEYLFVNDQLSNGIGDSEDSNKPPGTTDDDDLTELKTICAATWGAVWFEYEGGDVSKLAFYKAKQCTPANKVTFPFALSETNKLPEKLWVRAEPESGWTAQVEGKLVMKFGKADKSETWADDKLRFTVVKEVGNTKYFHAARDYMLEQNARLHVRYFKSGSHQIRITAMRHEATDMKVIETYHRNPKIYGMPDVVAKSQDYYDLIVNGNFCYFEGGTAGRIWGIANHQMTSRCHGGCVVGGAQNPATSVGGTSPLEGAGAEYLSANAKGSFAITTGVVPLNPPVHQSALGGFASNLVGGGYNIHPWFGLAEIGAASDRKKLIFTVTQTADNTQYPVQDLVQRLTTSGQTLCVAGDGGSSTAVAHRVEGDSTRVKYAGDKHRPGHYWINTYVGFKSDKPRP